MNRATLFASTLAAIFLAHQAPASALVPHKPRCVADASQFASISPGSAGLPTVIPGENDDFANENLALIFWCTSAVANGNFPDAENACGRAIDFNPENPAPYKLRGTAYLFERRYCDASLDFSRAAKLDPDDPENHGRYAEALRGLGNYRDATKELSVALKLAPNDARMWNARCWTRGIFARGLQAGLSDCNTALRLEANDPDVLSARGFIYLRMGKLGAALHDFGAALHEQPDLALAFYGRGIARLKRGEWKRGRGDVLHARAIDPAIDRLFVWRPLLSKRSLAGEQLHSERYL